jgi:hypothetical protein
MSNASDIDDIEKDDINTRFERVDVAFNVRDNDTVKRDKVLTEVETKIDILEQQVAALVVSYGEIAIFSESIIEHFFKYLPEQQRKELVDAMNGRRKQMLETLSAGGIVLEDTDKEPAEGEDITSMV